MSPTTPLKAARIEVRVTVEQKKLIERAAALKGRSITDFVSMLAAEEAEEILRAEHSIALPAETFDALLRALDEPPRALPELKRLFEEQPVWADQERVAAIERIAADIA
ncbi:DUF1778 domain-containing protein [Humibacter albus]|jgi:uncharacterized protein (DUF1778 family)|uniref:type II toxin-antitoxin system TacA family antitoxin n=1 Tax=Humibacter albus TaxID=427754 RepID=UPI0003B44E77|nr:DUF1778 domain-containing protein [Humibacter albus]